MVYSDPAVTDIACAGLNGLKMGDRTLTVRRASEVSTDRIQGERGIAKWGVSKGCQGRLLTACFSA